VRVKGHRSLIASGVYYNTYSEKVISTGNQFFCADRETHRRTHGRTTPKQYPLRQHGWRAGKYIAHFATTNNKIKCYA